MLLAAQSRRKSVALWLWYFMARAGLYWFAQIFRRMIIGRCVRRGSEVAVVVVFFVDILVSSVGSLWCCPRAGVPAKTMVAAVPIRLVSKNRGAQYNEHEAISREYNSISIIPMIRRAIYLHNDINTFVAEFSRVDHPPLNGTQSALDASPR